MSIRWRILHPGRLVVAVARDEITLADILFCVDETRKAGLQAYRKIYDLTRIARAMPQADVHLVGRRLSAAANHERFGPAAIVTSSGGIAELARILEDSSVENRQVRVFRDLLSARIWLDEVAPPHGVSEAGRE
jgi:hypothetical protein